MFASILDPLYQVVSAVLAAFYQFSHSFAVSIGLLTLAIGILVLPLTLKSTKSMLEMQKIQPEVKKLQDQYKGDVQARNEAMMALYKEHGVNPLGGCVPMLLPLPVFMVMYRTVHGLTRLCNAKLLEQPKYASLKAATFCPEHITATSRLFKDLAGRTQMRSFGLDLAQSAKTQIANNLVRGLPYLFLVLVVGATGYYQQRQVTVRNTGQPVNPQQQMLLRVMPAGFALISLVFPAALIVYFIVGNVSRIAQNGYITRRFYGEDGLGHQVSRMRAAATDDKAGAGGKNGTKAALPATSRPRPTNAKAATPPKGSATPAKGSATPGKGSTGPSSKKDVAPVARQRPTPPNRARPGTPRPTPRPKKS
jgi:YidC/Oxa1 family membrane protein insertase